MSAVDIDALTAGAATHYLVCQHVCRWVKTYLMPCHILKGMPDGRLKVLVFGERHWRHREHIKRVRYVEAGRVRMIVGKGEEAHGRFFAKT